MGAALNYQQLKNVKTKKYFTSLIATFLLLQPFSVFAASTGSGSTTLPEDGSYAKGSYTGTCVTTGYYSPLEGQDFYVTGSLAGDKRLNGNGTNGASGAEVFMGMAAGPRSLPFGTKVYIPGTGLLNVQDRGGAIIATETEDGETINRIDIWMGKGEEGLSRALNWGKRTHVCTYFPPDVEVSPGHETGTLNLPAATPLPKNQDPLSQKSWAEKLQTALKNAGYYEGEITGEYDEATRQALVDFQVDNNIVRSPTSYGAGYYGPETQAVLKQVLTGEEVTSTELPKAMENKNTVVLLERGDRGEEVSEVQEKLKEAGFFTHPYITDLYGQVTEDAVYSFQVSEGLIRSRDDQGAGQFTEDTKEALERFVKYSKDYVLISTSTPVVKIEPTEEASELIALNSLAPDLELEHKQHVFGTDLEYGDQGHEVKMLQDKLRAEGYYDMEGNFGMMTKLAVCEYQKDHGLIESCSEEEAGRVNEKTRINLNM